MFKKIAISLMLTFIFAPSFGQDDNWLSLPTNTPSNDTTTVLNFDARPQGELTIIKDDRLDKVNAFVAREKETVEGTKIDGYRIQIFFDESKTTAQSQKAAFINAYPEHKVYIDYMAPNYRVRVGNFRTQLQAEKLKQELIGTYPTSIVLKDKIELPVISLSTPE